MRVAAFLLFLLCLNMSNSLASEVYKTTAEDGTVVFSDQPSEGAEKIEVKPITTVPAVSTRILNTADKSSTDQAETAYEITITSPANDSAFHSGSGEVTIAAELSPGLKSGHTMIVTMDGNQINDRPGTITLSNVDRGTHILIAQVLDSDGSVIQSSAPVSFTLHRTTVSRPVPAPRN